jgi:hypothetical protein
MRYVCLGAMIVLGIATTVLGSGYTLDSPELKLALSDNEADVTRGVEMLRGGGPESLDELLRLRDELAGTAEEELKALPADGPFDNPLAKLDAVIDRVGGQRYCTASRLYWYTDIEQAQEAARAEGKPILSLRMMGYLTDELSCANSRFFRTTLYANQEVSQYLRDHFILHWKSVRPVPKITIDFGDGRKMERTLTGNSIHYVLAADGRPIDALPGLYGPKKFLESLSNALAVAEFYATIEDASKDDLLDVYHTGRLEAITRAWEADFKKVSVEEAPAANDAIQNLRRLGAGGNVAAAAPAAEKAAVIARPKAMVELNIIRVVTMRGAELERRTDDELWEKIAALHAEESQLDDASVALIRKQNPTALQAGRVTITKRRVEDPLLRMVRNLQSSIAVDTVRNEYLLHRQIHHWFAEGQPPRDVDKLNERVYAELFLTPSSDPWIGLVQPDAYTALENNGIVAGTTE